MSSLERVAQVQPAFCRNVGRVRLLRGVVQPKRPRLAVNPNPGAKPARLVHRHSQVAGSRPAHRLAPILAVGSVRYIPQVSNPVVGPAAVYVVDLASRPLASVHQPHDSMGGLGLPANLDFHVSIRADVTGHLPSDPVFAREGFPPVKMSGAVAEYRVDVLRRDGLGASVGLDLALGGGNQIRHPVVRIVAVGVLDQPLRPLSRVDRPSGMVRQQQMTAYAKDEMPPRCLAPDDFACLGSTSERFLPPQNAGLRVVGNNLQEVFESGSFVHISDYTSSQLRRERLAKTTPRAVRSQIETMLGNQDRLNTEETE